MESYDALLTRRSVRKYTNDEIEMHKIEKILKAGMLAPSAKNSKPWEFIVVRNKEKLNELSQVGQFWKMLPNAGAAIIPLANLEGYKSETTDYFIQDLSACTQNILIAANGEGLGAVWLGLYPKEELQQGVRKALMIPESIIPFSVISLGYPDAKPHPHTTYADEKVHFEKY